MDDREIDVAEGRVRRSLRALDQLAVPSLAEIRERPKDRRGARVGALIASVAVLLLALALGDRLNAWRVDRSASAPSPSSALGGTPPTLDDRYGLLVRLPGKSGYTLINEHGDQLLPTQDALIQAKTSPNGRYIALLVPAGTGFELRLLDGVARTIGQPIFTTSEKFARVSTGMVWASDSSAILLATTADDVANDASPITANLRAVDRSGAARLITVLTAFSLSPLGWDRSSGAIELVAALGQSGGVRYLRVSEGGALLTARDVPDYPLAADGAGRIIASSASCTPACRKFVLHDAATYDVLSQIELPPLGGSGNWAINFLPRSSDAIVNFSRTYTSAEGTFGLEVYPDAGRGVKRDLGTMRVAGTAGVVYTPNAWTRADGSAVFYLHAIDSAGGGEWSGVLASTRGGPTTPIMMAPPIATLILDPSLEAP